MNIHTRQFSFLAATCATLLMQASHGTQLSDFTLVDVNTQSPRAGDTVSPTQYRQQVSVWYFGSAT